MWRVPHRCLIDKIKMERLVDFGMAGLTVCFILRKPHLDSPRFFTYILHGASEGSRQGRFISPTLYVPCCTAAKICIK